MKTTVWAIAIAMALSAPAAAATKAKKTAKPADTMSEAQKTNDASWRLVKGSLPIWLPSWAQPIYQKMNSESDTTAAPKPKKASAKVKTKAVQQ